MGSLKDFEASVLGSDAIVLCISGTILCGCRRAFPSLALLQGHLEADHGRGGAEGGRPVGLQQLFSTKFVFPMHVKSDEVKREASEEKVDAEQSDSVRVTLPEGLMCVCLNEHDLGAFAGPTKCHLCAEDCDDLELLNKHVAEVHKVSQVLIGQNILFERPPANHPLLPAFFCPMLTCKYHIAESKQQAHFKTFKLLKQHYVKVHAAKKLSCDRCDQRFGTDAYLELHRRTCGQRFACLDCTASFPALESLQTHARRKGHLTAAPPRRVPRPPPAPPGLRALAPRPSALHIQAAIALSELGERRSAPRADIGIQTDPGAGGGRGAGRHSASCSPARPPHRRKVSAETQTRQTRLGKRAAATVSSQVQTHGEFGVRARRTGQEPGIASQGSQCRLSPPKAARLEDKVTQSSASGGPASPHLSFSLSVDIPDLECLWPLRNLTSGTQTSPRAAAPLRSLSLDSEEDGLGQDAGTRPLLADQGRQYSTETQTEFDLFLDSIGVLPTDSGLETLPLEAPQPLETSSMETQTGQGEEDFLLFTHNCTQTELERLFSPPAAASSSETQTALTGFQEGGRAGGSLQAVLGGQDTYSNIETQTCDFQDLLT